MNCLEARELLSAYYDDELADEQRSRLSEHLEQCSACAMELTQFEELSVEASREKPRLLGLTEVQIKEIEKQNKPTDHLTIYSPVGGVVIELKQEGDHVKTGERIYTVADLAFQNKEAIWYQDNDQVRNPYYGSTMLKCTNRVEKVVHDEPAMPDAHQSHQDHSQH